MKWYTLSNGRLCLGSEKELTNFHVATDIQLNYQISKSLTDEHIKLIGSYPEDWLNDEDINFKINHVAKQLFQDDWMAELNIINEEKISDKSINELYSIIKSQNEFYNKLGLSQISALL